MTIRPKTKRRVLILIVVSVLIVAGGAAFYGYRQKQIHGQYMDTRALAMKAYEQQHYSEAIPLFSKYSARYPNDKEALYAFAISREKVPEADGSHISHGITLFRHYLELDPGNSDAQHKLLDLESPRSSYAGEAINLANEILQSNPKDLDAIKAITQCRLEQGEAQYPEALKYSLMYNDLNPTDLEMQTRTLQILHAMHKPGSEIAKRANDLLAKNPHDPRFLVLKSVSDTLQLDDPNLSPDVQSTLAKDRIDSLLKATDDSQTPPDANFVMVAVVNLDRLGQFSRSQQLLNRAAKTINDPELLRLVVQRDWQSGKYADVVDRLKSIDANDPKTDTQLIALDALSLDELNKKDEANARLDALSKRTGDNAAVAWTIALKAHFNADHSDAKQQLDAYNSALQHDKYNPIIRFMLGQAYGKLGERELALQEWNETTAEAPSWAMPHILIVQALAEMGRGNSDDALRHSRMVELLTATIAKGANGQEQINQPEYAVRAELPAQFERVKASKDPAEIRRLLDYVTNFQKQHNFNDPGTMPVYVELLAKSGQQDQAKKVVTDALAAGLNADEMTYLRLAQACHDEQLGLEQNVLDADQKKNGMTPRLALAKAQLLAADGKPQDGLALMQSARKQDAGHPMQWDLATAEYREMTHDPGAREAWVKLGNDNPNDLSVQTTILAATSAWDDRNFIGTTIDRVHALTGDYADTWRIAKARWLIQGKDKNQTSDAIVLLGDIIKVSPQLAEPHLLRAQALEQAASTADNAKDRGDKRNAAIQEYRTTADLLPANSNARSGVFLSLMKLNVSAGRNDDVRTAFDRLAGLSSVPVEIAQSAAAIMNQIGDTDKAQQMLDRFDAQSTSPNAIALRASIDRKQGHLTRAFELYRKLLPEKDLSPAVIREAADFFGSQNDIAKANAFLDKLKTMDLRPGERQQILADFNEKYVGVDAAEAQYAAAATAAREHGGNTQPTIEWVGFELRHLRLKQAIDNADAGLAAFPGNADLLALKSTAEAASAIPDGPRELPSLMEAASADPDNPAVADTLKVLTDAVAHRRAPADVAIQLRDDLIPKYPKFYPLYSIAVQKWVEASATDLKRLDDAIALSVRAMNTFPDRADAAQMATTVYGLASRWSDMLQAAEQWRARTLDRPMQANIAVATASVFLDQPQEAVDRLEPYVEDAKSHPDENEKLLTAYAEGLVMTGNEEKAAALLTPWAQKSDHWRQVWLRMTILTHRTGESAGGWLDRLAKIIPADSPTDQYRLADNWFDVGRVFNYPKAFATSRDILLRLADRPDADERTFVLLAEAASQVPDAPTAEKAYRKSLEMDSAIQHPETADAANNLASLLSERNDAAALSEAEGWVKKALAAQPDNPNTYTYLDTLARIQLKEKNVDEAVATFERANKAKPSDLEIQIGLADAYAQAKRFDKAAACLAKIDAVLQGDQHYELSDELQQELNQTRQAVKQAPSARVSGAAN